jgi:hypothetical protein
LTKEKIEEKSSSPNWVHRCQHFLVPQICNQSYEKFTPFTYIHEQIELYTKPTIKLPVSVTCNANSKLSIKSRTGLDIQK